MTKLELYNTYKDRLENIYQIFVSVFKNPFVDRTQIPSFESTAQDIPNSMEDAEDYLKSKLKTDIIIHFPKITIENEYGRTHDIYDFFVKVPLYGNGRMEEAFKATRTSFTSDEIKKGYVHSHFPRLHSSGILKDWYHMCLGTGPITNTITRLITTEYDESLWLLFCTELGMYLGTESIKGGPYIQMAELGSGGKLELKDFVTNILANISVNCMFDLKKVINGLLDNQLLRFSYYDGKYCLGEPFETLLLKTVPLAEDGSLPSLDVFYDGMNLFAKQADTQILPRWYEELKEAALFTFKGKEMKIKKIETNEAMTPFKILHPDYVREAVNIILMLVNNYYERKRESTNGREETTDTSENKHITYILG